MTSPSTSVRNLWTRCVNGEWPRTGRTSHGERSSRPSRNGATRSRRRPDQSGVGVAVSQAERERLRSDLGVFSAAGVERAAWGWDRHGEPNREAFQAAERAALRAIEDTGRGPAWEEFRRSL